MSTENYASLVKILLIMARRAAAQKPAALKPVKTKKTSARVKKEEVDDIEIDDRSVRAGMMTVVKEKKIDYEGPV